MPICWLSFAKYILRFLTSHIYFHLDDCDKPYQSSTWEMEDGADVRLEAAEAQEIPQG